MPASDLDNILYWSDVGDLDRRERTRAGPSDQGLVVMWSIYSPLLFLFSFVVMIVFLAIITNPKVRRNPFNKYILFLSFPDFVYSFLCAITCLASALNNGYSSWEMCQFQVFYLYFGCSANSWLNGVMAWEVYKLLRSSSIRRRYFPPSNRQVYLTSCACYAIALVAACLPLMGTFVDWIPEPGIQAGFLCQAVEENVTHTIVWWFLVAPVTFALPYLVATFVFYDVLIRSKLLPPKGKRRELTVYFFRIGAMFLFLWMPTIAIMYIFRGMASPWWTWGLGLFSHTQGLVSALVTMSKQDVREAVWDFVSGCCCCYGRRSRPAEDGVDHVIPSKSSTAQNSSIEMTSALQPHAQPNGVRATVDDLGLPIQDSDFQFLDEASSGSIMTDQDEDPKSSASCV